MYFESIKPQSPETLDEANVALLGRLERLHAAQMAATMAAVEQTLMECGLSAKVFKSKGSVAPASEHKATLEAAARLLAVTRAYFQSQLPDPAEAQTYGSSNAQVRPRGRGAGMAGAEKKQGPSRRHANITSGS